MLSRRASIILTGLSFSFIAAIALLASNYGLPFDTPFEIYILTTLAIAGGTALAILISEILNKGTDPVTGAPGRRFRDR